MYVWTWGISVGNYFHLDHPYEWLLHKLADLWRDIFWLFFMNKIENIISYMNSYWFFTFIREWECSTRCSWVLYYRKVICISISWSRWLLWDHVILRDRRSNWWCNRIWMWIRRHCLCSYIILDGIWTDCDR